MLAHLQRSLPEGKTHAVCSRRQEFVSIVGAPFHPPSSNQNLDVRKPHPESLAEMAGLGGASRRERGDAN